jgi:hypothetical protein
VTEDEARTKWCPFAREWESGGNRFRFATAAERKEVDEPEYAAETAASFPCIASACMAWRRPAMWRDDAGLWDTNTAGWGYCGLAGAAQ